MSVVTAAVVPVILLLGLGTLLRRWAMNQADAWRGIELLSYRVFTPALFVSSIAGSDLGSIALGPLVAAVIVPTALVGALVVAIRRPLTMGGPRLTSVLQGSIRINTYVGLIFASALAGTDGVAVFAVGAAVLVPFVNLVSVAALTTYGEHAAPGTAARIVRELGANPLVLGCAAGTAINLLRLQPPTAVMATIDLLAAPALACGTLVAGAAMSFRLAPCDLRDFAAASVLKLVVLPAAAFVIAGAAGLSDKALLAVVLICAVPTSPSSYVLASRMGGDARFMASLVGVQTLVAVVTLPAFVAVAT